MLTNRHRNRRLIFLKLLFYECGGFARVYICTPPVFLVPVEKRALNLLGLVWQREPPCGWWESNLGPVKEQQVLLTAEASLQFQHSVLLSDLAIELRR